MMVGDGSNKKSMTYVGNIVDFISFLMKNPDGYQFFNYADKPDLTTRDIGRIEMSVDLSVPSFRIPYWVGLAGGYTFDVLARLTGKKLLIFSVRVKKFCTTTQFDASKAHATAFTAPFSIDEALERTLRYELGE
jgi:nucleoside-diphosphate-sugar epimerase